MILPVRHRHRSRQRGAPQAPLRSDDDRYVGGLRQSLPHLSDPPQHAFRRSGDDQRRIDRRRCGFACGLADVDDLHRDEHTPPLSLSRSRIESWSPEHLTIPEVTNATALGILTAISDRVPALADATGWHVRFGRELNATDDRPRFVAGGIAIARTVADRRRQAALAFHRSTCRVPRAASPVDRPLARARIAYRDVASATNKLTLIAAMLPANVISTPHRVLPEVGAR